MEKVTLELEQFVNGNIKVFSGREQGKQARKKLKIETLDKSQNISVEVKFPEDTMSLSPSFFLGLFGPSIRKLGETDFKQKYQFKCKEFILESIDSAITRALKSSNPLE
ncbi:hypothetical protein [Bacillus halotolerans]|uniref:hypothetical protein n=1 Tax=Bacillus halotolerans TaxID=260554 RepID=UPI00240F8385|nr:hypothetical protein [Bacillus halotolerans]MDG3075169.1 hypothetical protein [Bacillus halotolerans]